MTAGSCRDSTKTREEFIEIFERFFDAQTRENDKIYENRMIIGSYLKKKLSLLNLFLKVEIKRVAADEVILGYRDLTYISILEHSI